MGLDDETTILADGNRSVVVLFPGKISCQNCRIASRELL